MDVLSVGEYPAENIAVTISNHMEVKHMNRKMFVDVCTLLFSFPGNSECGCAVVWDGTAQAPTQGAGTPLILSDSWRLVAWFAGQVDSGQVLIEAILWQTRPE